jgi:hypothetical protein
MAKKNSAGLERQDAFIKSIEGQDFDFGLVMTQAFLKGIRDIGYKSTATALFEDFDNSIQAGAENIHLLFDFDKGKSGKSNPDRIAIIDDGHGMSKEMIRIAVLWGGSDRLDDRQGMGKYGYGLPSSCVSIGQRYTVISKREDMKDWYAVTIDIEEIGKHSPEYIDAKTGRVVAPEAKPAPIPDFIAKYLKAKKVNLTNGTIVLIDRIDRLTKSSFKPLKSFLSLETGVTYRNYLRSTNIFIDGEPVEPVDPLFITEGYRFYDESDAKAEALPSLEIKVPNSTDPKKIGTVKFRFSVLPYGFFDVKDSNDEFDEEENEVDGDEIINDQKKKDKSKRLTVRKNNNGIIFLRKGRQIDVVDSKIPWTKIQNNDRYWSVEVDFSPELDEEFSITTSKQQIVVSPRMWNIIYDAGVFEAIQTMRKKYIKQKEEADKKRENELVASPEKRDEFAENLMKKAARDFEVDKESQPQHVKKEGEENLEKQAKKIASDTGLPQNVVKQELEAQTESKPYKLDYFDESEGPFYRAEQVGGQVVIYINKAHRFYTDLFHNPRTDAFMKNALALIVFVLGHSELRVTDEKRKWYKIERNAWSIKLETTLETLSKHFSKSVDDQVHEEEMIVSEA